MKFVLSARTQYQGNYWRLEFIAQYDNSIPEDKRFSVATPSARLEMTVSEAVAQQYELGAAYYFYSQDVA